MNSTGGIVISFAIMLFILVIIIELTKTKGD